MMTCAKCRHSASNDYVAMVDQCPRCGHSPFKEVTERATFNSLPQNTDPNAWVEKSTGDRLANWEAELLQLGDPNSEYAQQFEKRPRPEFANRVNPILDAMRRWELDPADLLWAMDHGAKKPNDKRSKRLRGAARIGRSELKPYEDEWYFHQARRIEGEELIAAFDHARRVTVRLLAMKGTP